MYKKIFALALGVLFAFSTYVRADEGMWLPLLLKQYNEAQMDSLGLKISADDIYNINNSSLKDAVVSMGGFCTGEIVSADGLMLTNHHCGFDAIQTNSSVEHDYITNGFWAMNREEELPNPGLFVRFLVRMEDVTDQVMKQIPDTIKEVNLQNYLKQVYAPLIKDASEDGRYEVVIRPFYNGNQYFLFVYEVFRDVRLVGAPPQAVGDYGGDTDNWMWPRHTGDFSVFRVYCGKDNKPAEYSKDNVPYHPKSFLPVSMKGLQKDDFTMTIGYPGRTDRYLTSYGIKMAIDKLNPSIVKVRDSKLKLMKSRMEASDKIRIAYAAKYSSTANYWKYYIGQTKGLKRMNVVGQKEQLENRFQSWANADASRKQKYGDVLKNISMSYQSMNNYILSRIYYSEAVLRGPELFQFVNNTDKLDELLSDKKSDKTEVKKAVEELKEKGDEYFKEYDAETDRIIVSALFEMYAKDVPADQQPPVFAEIQKKYDGSFDAWSKELFKNSLFVSQEKFNAFLKSPSAKKLHEDPAYKVISAIADNYNTKIKPEVDRLLAIQSENNRLFLAGIMEMMPEKKFAPDANGTMRVSYGQVKDYYPMDAVHYDYFTTSEGILEKMDNSNEEFIVDPKLEKLLRDKDFGPYGDNGQLKICFISTNDITGGNSGSPVINANGELTGLCFDGNWEAMSGDIAYDPNYKRTISVDIRYVLFIMDKFAGAGHLVKEMKLVN
ncbi:MAG TPA: S46 family peptidase [Bacteroidia bacterium]|nr:S46 family peptidase [Bacteroidia bacterium]